MIDQPDAGVPAAESSGGELRRDRRRLREAARADAERLHSQTDRVEPADVAHPETGGLSAFEALGFDRQELESSASPAAIGLAGRDSEPLTPPQSTGVAPPLYGSPHVEQSAAGHRPSPPDGSGTAGARETATPPTFDSATSKDSAPRESAPQEPPPLLEPPAPPTISVPRVTHAFAQSAFSAPTPPAVVPGATVPPATGYVAPLPPTTLTPPVLPTTPATSGFTPTPAMPPPAAPRVPGTSRPGAPLGSYDPPGTAVPPIPTGASGSAPADAPPAFAPATSTDKPSAPDLPPVLTYGFPPAPQNVPTTASPDATAHLPGQAAAEPGDASRPFFAASGSAHSAAPAGDFEFQAAGAGSHPVLGPLAPRSPEAPPQLAMLDRIAMVAAVIMPPVGFGLGLYASAKGRAERGWSSTVARASLWVSAAMAVVFLIGGSVLWFEHQERVEAQRLQDEADATYAAIVEESAAFCSAVAAAPALFATDDPDYGWPQSDDAAGYVQAVADYAALWQSLAPSAPPAITEQAASFSARVTEIAVRADSLPRPNRAGDLLDLHSVPDITAIEAHVAEYCVPEAVGE